MILDAMAPAGSGHALCFRCSPRPRDRRAYGGDTTRPRGLAWGWLAPSAANSAGQKCGGCSGPAASIRKLGWQPVADSRPGPPRFCERIINFSSAGLAAKRSRRAAHCPFALARHHLFAPTRPARRLDAARATPHCPSPLSPTKPALRAPLGGRAGPQGCPATPRHPANPPRGEARRGRPGRLQGVAKLRGDTARGGLPQGCRPPRARGNSTRLDSGELSIRGIQGCAATRVTSCPAALRPPGPTGWGGAGRTASNRCWLLDS